MIFRHPQFLFFLILLPALALAWRLRRGRVSGVTLAFRLAIAALLVLALADPVLGRPAPSQGSLIVLLDQSDSLGDEGKAALRARAEALSARHTGLVSTIAFGADTVAELPGAGSPAAQAPRADQTDIAGALRAARGLLAGAPGRVVLLSDGAQTRGDALAEAQALGVPVDTVTIEQPARPEIWIAGLDVPRTLRTDEEYTITIVAISTEAAQAQLQLFENARQLEQQQVTLSPGENRFTYRGRAGQPGILQLRASIDGTPDTFAQNNGGAATALVAPQPKVLLLESRPGAGARLRAALRPAGVQSDLRQAQDLPTQLSELDEYEGVVLLDVPAGELTLDQMATLREFTRSEGRGLVATGGRSSFTLGAYKGTPLEEALPVAMDPPPRPERPPVTLLIILDHSLSMGSAIEISKFDMAKESALLATESLRSEDWLGVLAFDDTQEWVVDFQTLGTGLSLGQIQERIGALQLGGGTDICGALEMGLSALARQPGQVRHAVLMTDGQSFLNRGCGPYNELIDRARAQDITLSSIAIGEDADTELLQELARWGAGRYHFAGQPEDIPRLTLIESQIASAEPQIEGEFRANLEAPHPLLRNFTPNQIPRLEGYVGTTIKPEAELVLKAPDDDPVLAAWQYGLGRAVAWTPSVESPWAEAWPNWPDYGKFWAQIIRYTLPEPDSGSLQARVTPRADNSSGSSVAAATIAVDSFAPSGETIDLADTVATVTLPDGSTRRIPLRQTAPGHYAADVALPSDGPYAIAVEQRKDDRTRMALAGYVQSPSAEYMPSASGAALLERISAATGGQALSGAEPAQSPAPIPAGIARELWPWLLLAAALLFPLEIAVRRGWLRRRRQ
ncbi:MAG TPA: VWA domain-containing protein [Roseiflexaceae bacterium]|nr:VWA domain-containing protein [Roseiflexaceae bacterium]